MVFDVILLDYLSSLSFNQLQMLFRNDYFHLFIFFFFLASITCWNCLFDWKALIIENTDSILPLTHISFLGKNRLLLRLVLIHFTCPIISYILHCCKVFTFHRPSLSASETKYFINALIENHKKNLHINVSNITNLMQMNLYT